QDGVYCRQLPGVAVPLAMAIARVSSAASTATAESWGLLADAAVDPLPEQIGVAEVAGVLLDHVEYHLAQRDGRAILHGNADGQVGRAGDELLRAGDLLVPGAPRVG